MQILSLESFDDPVFDDAAEQGTYQDGYDEGYAAGLQAASAAAATLNEECAQALTSIDFTYAEACKQTLDALAPLLQDIVDKVLPHCVENGFANQLSEMLAAAAQQDGSKALTVHVHPTQHAAVTQAAASTVAQIDVHADPALTEHAAMIKNGRTETLLDMDRLLSAITETMRAIHHIENRTDAHG